MTNETPQPGPRPGPRPGTGHPPKLPSAPSPTPNTADRTGPIQTSPGQPSPATTTGVETDSGREERATARVDAVLSEVDDIDQAPLADHHDRLAAAHEKLHALLDEHRQD